MKKFFYFIEKDGEDCLFELGSTKPLCKGQKHFVNINLSTIEMTKADGTSALFHFNLDTKHMYPGPQNCVEYRIYDGYFVFRNNDNTAWYCRAFTGQVDERLGRFDTSYYVRRESGNVVDVAYFREDGRLFVWNYKSVIRQNYRVIFERKKNSMGKPKDLKGNALPQEEEVLFDIFRESANERDSQQHLLPCGADEAISGYVWNEEKKAFIKDPGFKSFVSEDFDAFEARVSPPKERFSFWRWLLTLCA